jgi:hypothetical protein
VNRLGQIALVTGGKHGVGLATRTVRSDEGLAWSSEASNRQFGSFVELIHESLSWLEDPKPLHLGE